MRSHDYFTVDKGWAWFALVASFIACFITGGICFSMGAYFPVYILLYDPIYTALITSLPGSLILLLGSLSQYLSMNIGYTKLMILGAIVGALGFLGAAFTTNVYLLILLQGGLVGLGSGIVFTAAISVNKVCFERKYLLASAIALCGTALGCLCFPLLITKLIEQLGLRGSHFVMAAIFMAVSLPGFILVRIPKLSTILETSEDESNKQRRPDKENVKIVLASTSLSSPGTPDSLSEETIKIATPSPDGPVDTDESSVLGLYKWQSVMAFASCALWQMATNIIYIMISDFGRQVKLTPLQSSALISWIGIGDLIGRFAITCWGLSELAYVTKIKNDSRALRRYGDRVNFSNIVIYCATLLIHGTVCALFVVPLKTFLYLSILSTCFGIIFGIRITVLPPLVAQLYGQKEFFRAYGVTMMTCGVGAVIGTPLASFLMTRYKNPYIIFYLTSSAFFASVILCNVAFWTRVANFLTKASSPPSDRSKGKDVELA